MDTRKYGPPCGQPHPDLKNRTDLRGEEFTPVTCEARFDAKVTGLVAHKGKHRAHLGKHLIRWS